MLYTITKLVLFAISTLGTFQLVRKICNDKIDVFFLPSLTIAIQVTILFFAGILNLLPEISYILYFVGLLGIVMTILGKNRTEAIKAYLNDGYFMLFVIMLVMVVSVHGKLFSHYDNFSHWAIVVRHMLETNKFPNFESSLILFQEYPLGSAVYIYYFAKMIKTSESIQMLAQIYMIIAAVLPLYSFAQKRSTRVDCIFAIFVNFVLVYNITVGDLLVDTLLPTVGVCGLLFAIKYCSHEVTSLNFWFLSFYMTQIVQIKNSGIFFAMAIICVCAVNYWRNKDRISNLCSAFFPFLTIIIWQKHCKYVFVSAATSKHAMTLENYKSVFGNKTPENVRVITNEMLKLTILHKEVLGIVALSVMLGIFTWLYVIDLWREFIRTFVFCTVLYVCYQIGMLGMYLFSMPTEEAIILAGGERYLRTIILAILIIYIVLFIRAASSDVVKVRTGNIASLVAAASIIAFLYLSHGSLIMAPMTISNSQERLWIENNKDAYSVPMHDSYCMLIPDSDDGYAYYLLKYIFQSTEVGSQVVKNVDDIECISSKYLFVYDTENEVLNSWIKENYPDQFGNSVIIR